MKKSIILISLVSISLFSCNNSKTGDAKATALDSLAKTVFPESTDSLANGLHPHYVTSQNILGKWVLHHPVDSSNSHLSFIEFMADQSVKSENYPFVTPVKWALHKDSLVITYNPKEGSSSSPFNDTLVVEAVSDSSMHFHYVQEPNFIAHWTRK